MMGKSATTGRHADQTMDRFLDLHGSWPKLCGCGEIGAVVVRPDGHVLWRCKDATDLGCGRYPVGSAPALYSGDDKSQTGKLNTDATLLQHITAGLKAAIQTCIG